MRKLTLFLLCMFVLSSCKIVSQTELKELEEAEKQGNQSINIQDVWQNQIHEFAENRKLKFSDISHLKDLDNTQLAEKASKNSPSAKWHIFIEDQAKILEIHEKKEDGSLNRSAYMLVDFAPFDGKVDAKLQMGSIFRGSALRDSLPFMSFDAFENQIEYSQSSRKLHQFVEEYVTSNLRGQFEINQEIDLFAVAILEHDRKLTLTPIEVK